MLCPPAPSTKEACQFLNTCGEPFSNESAAGAAVSGSAPHTLTSGFNAFIALAYARDKSAAAYRGDDRHCLRFIFKNLKAHRRVTRL